MNNAIHVAMISDEAYASPLLVAVGSLLASASGRRLFLHVVDDNLSERTKNSLEKLKAIRPFRIEYLPFSRRYDNIFNGGSSHFPPNVYSRLFLHDMLTNVNKLIYLDCDILVLQSLDELWNVDLHDACVGAVPDIQEHIRIDNDFINKFIEDCNVYCNSGVLLLDLDKLRKLNFTDLIVETYYKIKDKLSFPDQDVLNCVMQGKFHILDKRWNYLVPLVAPDDVSDDIAILHYAGLKPWRNESVSGSYMQVRKQIEAILSE